MAPSLHDEYHDGSSSSLLSLSSSSFDSRHHLAMNDPVRPDCLPVVVPCQEGEEEEKDAKGGNGDDEFVVIDHRDQGEGGVGDECTSPSCPSISTQLPAAVPEVGPMEVPQGPARKGILRRASRTTKMRPSTEDEFDNDEDVPPSHWPGHPSSLSSSSSSWSFSSSSPDERRRVVSFRPGHPVSSIRDVPRTPIDEISNLYYSVSEIRNFKREHRRLVKAQAIARRDMLVESRRRLDMPSDVDACEGRDEDDSARRISPRPTRRSRSRSSRREVEKGERGHDSSFWRSKVGRRFISSSSSTSSSTTATTTTVTSSTNDYTVDHVPDRHGGCRPYPTDDDYHEEEWGEVSPVISGGGHRSYISSMLSSVYDVVLGVYNHVDHQQQQHPHHQSPACSISNYSSGGVVPSSSSSSYPPTCVGGGGGGGRQSSCAASASFHLIDTLYLF